MYESGYGGDKADIYGGGYNAQEEELRRKREQMQQPMQQQSPYQQQDTKPQQPAQQAPQPVQQQQQAQALQQQQKTFAELQQAGQARPAPPPAQPPTQQQAQQAQQVQALQQVQQQPMQQYYGQQVGAGGAPSDPFQARVQEMQQAQQQFGGQWDAQTQQGFQQQLAALQQAGANRTPQQQQLMQQAQSMGLDPVAAMMNPDGFQQMLQQQAIAQPNMQTGEYNLWAGQYGDGSRSMGGYQATPDMMVNSMASSVTPPPGAFTGDLGAYLAGQLNNSTLPQTAYQGSNLSPALTNMALPDTPTYTQDPQVLQAIQQMNTQMAQTGGYQPGTGAGATGGAAGGAGAGGGAGASGAAGGAVTAAGVNPLAAAGGGGSSTSVTSTSTGGQPVGGAQVRDVLSQALANPSAFDNEQVMNLYNRMGQNIDDQFSQEDTRLREEMAARGLSDSSIMGGRLSDLNVGRRQARTELANQLGIQRAQDFANARNAAIGLGLQQAGQDNSFTLGSQNNALQGRGLDLQANNQAYNQRMGGLQFQNQLGQQRFTNQLASGDFGLRRAGQQFGQGLAGAQFNNEVGQQGFTNALNLSGQRYNQNMGWANALSGYGQQAFNNDLATAQFNAGQQSQGDQFLMSLLGLGG